MARKPLPRLLVHFERDPAVLQALRDVVQAQADDFEDGRPGELVEHEHGVEPVEQLGREILLCALEHVSFGGGCDEAGFGVAGGGVREDVATEVACQANDGVLGIEDEEKEEEREKRENVP